MDRKLVCPQCKKTLIFKDNVYICRQCNTEYPVKNDIACFVEKDKNQTGFTLKMFENLLKIEKKHFWHIGRKEIIYQLLKLHNPKDSKQTKMIEFGCGNGSILQYLFQNGFQIEGSDISLSCLQFFQKRNKKISLYQSDALNTPFHDETYHVIGLFDVLEHIENDTLALKESFRICKKNGLIIITVPAHKYLWSYFDEFSQHKRRYSKKELNLKLKKAGFEIEKISFYIFFLLPIFFLKRKLFKSQSLKINQLSELKTIPIINGIFLFLLRIEKILLKYFNLPFGTSLICIAKKR